VKKSSISRSTKPVRSTAKPKGVLKIEKSNVAIEERRQRKKRRKEEAKKLYLYKVDVDGGGRLSVVDVRLDRGIVDLISNDGRKWKGAKTLLAGDKVYVQFECVAPNGTGWHVVVTNETENKKIAEKRGMTGDSTPNYSEFEHTVNSE
jgi:hypothetical protein